MSNLIADEPDPRNASSLTTTTPSIRRLGLGVPELLPVGDLPGRMNEKS
jgi:hypothetical protein